MTRTRGVVAIATLSAAALRASRSAGPFCVMPSCCSPVVGWVRSGWLASGLGAVQLVRLLAREQPDLDEIERADEAVADAEAAGAGDRVAQRPRPVVLHEDQGGCRVVRDLLQDVPGILVGERADAVGCRL